MESGIVGKMNQKYWYIIGQLYTPPFMVCSLTYYSEMHSATNVLL